jgi:hypothetical protein
MGAVKQVSREQRRARLARRHHLSEPASGALGAVDSLVAVHSSDPTTVFLSAWARVPGFQVADLEHLLYEERSIVRHWAMRRTLWVVPRARLPHVIASSTRPLGVKERRRTVRFIEEGGVADDGEAWLAAVLPMALNVIRANGEVLARQLSNEIPELAAKITFRNKAGEVVGTSGMSSRALVQLGLESRVVRARPAGTWVSGQYRWAELEAWLGSPLEDVQLEEACASLLADWLRAYGPATETDIRWWTGWPVTQIRSALTDIEAVAVDLGEDGTGFMLPDDLEDVASPEPWVALLPSLDTTTMGWKERDWYLGDHYPTLFDRNGNAGPTVWVDGLVVGGWAQRRDGEVVYELFEDVSRDSRSMIEARRDQLQEWLGGVTITPRFRSPHDKKLAP